MVEIAFRPRRGPALAMTAHLTGKIIASLARLPRARICGNAFRSTSRRRPSRRGEADPCADRRVPAAAAANAPGEARPRPAPRRYCGTEKIDRRYPEPRSTDLLVCGRSNQARRRHNHSEPAHIDRRLGKSLHTHRARPKQSPRPHYFGRAFLTSPSVLDDLRHCANPEQRTEPGMQTE